MSVHLGVVVAVLSVTIGYFSVQDPESVQGICMAGFWAWIVATCIYVFKKRDVYGAWLTRVILLGLIARFVMAFVHLAVGFWFYKGAVDFPGYHATAVYVGRGLLQGRLTETRGLDLGTRVTEHLSGLFYLLSGPGIVGMFLLSGVIGFLGSYLFLRAFETEFPGAQGKERRFLALSLFFLPSLTYWAILLGKDSWIFFFLGCLSLSFVKIQHKFRLRYLLGLGVGLLGVTFIRFPVGAILVFAVSKETWGVSASPSSFFTLLAPSS